MTHTVSTSEAKARLSELLRAVSRGDSVTITSHGRVVAELVPPRPAAETWDHRVERLYADGVLTLAERPASTFGSEPAVPAPGALARFLADRDEDE